MFKNVVDIFGANSLSINSEAKSSVAQRRYYGGVNIMQRERRLTLSEMCFEYCASSRVRCVEVSGLTRDSKSLGLCYIIILTIVNKRF